MAVETVLHAFAREVPNDASRKLIEKWVISGPALLETHLLEFLVTRVRGVFPGVADGTL